MAGITLQQAQDNLNAALDNLTRARKVRESQVAGSVGGRKTTNHELAQLQAEVEFWDRKCRALTRGGVGFLQVVPLG